MWVTVLEYLFILSYINYLYFLLNFIFIHFCLLTLPYYSFHIYVYEILFKIQKKKKKKKKKKNKNIIFIIKKKKKKI